jgi:catechol 2,3-dioxygenase-like lactoylglutathione lyase family enzyme
MKPKFAPGDNIAMKIPPHEFPATVAFYRDVLGLGLIDEEKPAIVFDFGGKRLWLDEVPHLSQAEIWLEVKTDDPAAAARHLNTRKVVRCDGVEELPKGFDGFWISNPAGIIHLVSREQ